MGVAIWGIRRVVVHTILMVPLGQATELEPPPLSNSLTGTTPREVHQLQGGPSRTCGRGNRMDREQDGCVQARADGDARVH
jgi:hypothetical protein